MKKSLLLSLFVLLCAIAMAQPANYVPGTQVCWNFNGRDHGYFKAAGNGEKHILISFTGMGETSCSNYQTNVPQKLLRDNGLNWDGRTVRAPGDTIVWEIFTIVTNTYVTTTVQDINYFLTHIGPIDTSNHSRFHIMGLSLGVGRQWEYLYNAWGDYSPYRKIFSTSINLSGTWQSNNLTNITNNSGGMRHWVWHGLQDSNGNTPPAAGIDLYNALRGSKRITLQDSSSKGRADHNSVTWDSCMSLAGTDTLTNRWLWMVRKDSVTVPPPGPCDTCWQPCADIGGGPANYVPGTQVNWTFNGRTHGYFRAAGCGERHVLIAFTNDSATNSTNYQDQSPQKLLNDLGLNWNGRTVRAPGDTIVWEVLTIINNTYVATAVDDINYFFGHIAAIDTTERRRFHTAGVGGGVGRQWDYLTNSWNLNSPYAGIFSTTFSVSTTWLSNNYTRIAAYSANTRNWVWHGASDANALTPPAASSGLYSIMNGEKHLTLQTGGGYNATTWDSAFSLQGTDTATNRWIWMVTDGGNNLLSNNGQMSLKQDVILPKNTLQQSLRLYPNPSNSFVRLDFRASPRITYRASVIDINGRVVRVDANVKGPDHQVDVSQLRKGIYILQLEGGGTRVQQQFVKE